MVNKAWAYLKLSKPGTKYLHQSVFDNCGTKTLTVYLSIAVALVSIPMSVIIDRASLNMPLLNKPFQVEERHTENGTTRTT